MIGGGEIQKWPLFAVLLQTIPTEPRVAWHGTRLCLLDLARLGGGLDVAAHNTS